MKPSIIPDELKGKPLYDFLVKNEKLIDAAKKSQIKKADAFSGPHIFIDEKGSLITKAVTDKPVIAQSATTIKIDAVINTTNYFDSHFDVHIPGIWNKSLSDNKKAGFYLLECHEYEFESVIGEGMKGAANKISWQDLGFQYPGITEALVFSGNIEKARNEFMFGQYASGYVRQHSVGMRYVKLITCINDEDYPVQKENWDKYFPMIVNADEADAEGFFWAILEAKVVEGSAVLFGSNILTPVQNIEDVSTKNEPDTSTQEEPQRDVFDIGKAIKTTIFII